MLFSNKHVSFKTSLNVSKILMGFLVMSISLASSCTKEKIKIPNTVRSEFFKNPNDAFQSVQRLITRFHEEEKLETIERISYLHGKDRSYAFVDYKSNLGSRNLIIENTLIEDGGDGWTTYQCDGTCNCLVTATVSGGVLKFKCSCESCDMISHSGN